MSHYSFYLHFIKTKCQTKKAQIQLSSLIIIFEIYSGGLQSYFSDLENSEFLVLGRPLPSCGPLPFILLIFLRNYMSARTVTICSSKI